MKLDEILDDNYGIYPIHAVMDMLESRMDTLLAEVTKREQKVQANELVLTKIDNGMFDRFKVRKRAAEMRQEIIAQTFTSEELCALLGIDLFDDPPRVKVLSPTEERNYTMQCIKKYSDESKEFEAKFYSCGNVLEIMEKIDEIER